MEDMIVVTELGMSIRLPQDINCVGVKSDYTSKIFTVEIGDDVFVYEHPKDASKKEIRTAIALDFCYLDKGYTDKVTGRYPNYQIEERKGGCILDQKHAKGSCCCPLAGRTAYHANCPACLIKLSKETS